MNCVNSTCAQLLLIFFLIFIFVLRIEGQYGECPFTPVADCPSAITKNGKYCLFLYRFHKMLISDCKRYCLQERNPIFCDAFIYKSPHLCKGYHLLRGSESCNNLGVKTFFNETQESRYGVPKGQCECLKIRADCEGQTSLAPLYTTPTSNTCKDKPFSDKQSQELTESIFRPIRNIMNSKDCQSLCLKYYECKSFTYLKDELLCNLNSKKCSQSVDSSACGNNPGAEYYEKLCDECDVSQFTEGVTRELLGNTLVSQNGLTIDQCKLLCLQNVDCKSVTFYEPLQDGQSDCILHADFCLEFKLCVVEPASQYYEKTCFKSNEILSTTLDSEITATGGEF